MPADTPTQLLGLSLQQLSDLAQGFGQPAYRGRQVFDALYRQRVAALGEITTLPASWRAELEQAGYEIGMPAAQARYRSTDGTVRYLFGFADGQTVETVWMPEGDDGEAGEDEDQIPGSVLPAGPAAPLVSIAKA